MPTRLERGAAVAVDQEMAARLRRARALAGFAGPTEAIRAFDWTETYLQHENGTRGFGRNVLKYSQAFRVREEWLRYGKGGPRNGGAVLVLGTISEFGIVTDKPKPMGPHTLEYIECPPEAGEYVAYRVTGDFNYPSLFNGDVVYTTLPGIPESVLGRHCVARLADGARRVCVLARGTSPGLFLLMGLNASPIADAKVVEAAPIVWIKRS